MADGPEDYEKTEEPTSRKLQRAREEGNLPQSQEVGVAAMVVMILIILTLFAPAVTTEVVGALMVLQTNAHDVRIGGNQYDVFVGLRAIFSQVVVVVGVVFVLLIATAIFSAFVQGSVTLSIKRIQPKFSKLNVIEGFKRIYGVQAVVEFVKGITKIGVISVIVLIIVANQLQKITAATSYDMESIPELMRDLVLQLLLASLFFLVIVAFLDVLYVNWKWRRDLRMTPKEVKDEFRQMEGDPQVKRRLAQLRVERTRQRMMAKVPDATVVITNPTHFAVALKYERDEMDAPVCVAKGMDYVAQRIREIAEENDVPLVENAPLARTLYRAVEVDEEIPEEHYKAVAEIIMFIYRGKEKADAF